MVTFVVGFGLMILLIIIGSFFIVRGDVATDLHVEISSQGTQVQNIFTANTLVKSQDIDLHGKMEKYYRNPESQDSIEASIEQDSEVFLEEHYNSYRFTIEDKVEVSDASPPGPKPFLISTPSGEQTARISVDSQVGEPYQPVAGALQ